MEPLTHLQVQEILRAGINPSGPEHEDLANHLSTCSECQAYAALVTELATALPAIYPSAALSVQDIRQKAAEGSLRLLRQARLGRTMHGMRTVIVVGTTLVFLLILALVTPKLLPDQPAGLVDTTSTVEIIPAATPTVETTPPLEDVQGTVRLQSPDWHLTAIFHPQTRELQIVDGMGYPVVSYQAKTDGMILGPWSPDSKQLVFWPGRQGSSLAVDGLPMWLLDVQTGQAKQVSEIALFNKAYQSWSPDGKTLAFSNGGYRSAQIGKRLSFYHVESGETTGLTPPQNLVTGAVAWSPAGNLIAVAAVESDFTSRDNADYMGWDNPAIAARRIYVVNPQNGGFQPLTQSGAYEDAPLWNLDGSRLYFVQQADATARLMAFDVNSTRLEALPGCEAPMPGSAGYYGQVDWSNLYTACQGSDGLLPLWINPLVKETLTADDSFCGQVERNFVPSPGYQTYCDADYSFAFDYPEDWNIRLISSAPDATAAPNGVRKALRFEENDMSNYIRTDTYRLYVSMDLEQRMRRFYSYAEREFPDKEYPSLSIGGKQAYAIINRWVQDYSAVYLFFEHGDYYTVMEIKAIDRAGLDQNWAIARTIQIHGATADTNIIPAELIEDSYALLEPTPEAAATTSNNAFSVGFSSDGSILAFNSDVNGLVPEDQQGVMDPFIYNLENGTFFQVIPTIGGNNRAATSRRVISLSADGRYLLYRLRSNSPQPAAEHYNDVLLRDLSTGKDSRIDFLPLEEALGTGIYPSLSPDGRYLALESVIKDHWQIHLLERSTGRLTLISMADASSPLANGDSLEAVFSADNRYLAFVSSASNLIDGDTRCSETNLNCVDVFLYEIATGKLERIPAKIQFTMGNPYPYLTVSADARWLAWTELIDPSPIYRPVIRLHDRSTGKTETVWDGMGAYQTGHSPSISNDGRWLAFGALAEYDYGEIPLPDSYPQVYLLDRQTNEAIVVSKDANNNWGNGPSGIVALQQEGWSSDIHISGDGRYVAFSSQAANLLPPGVTKRQCFDPYVVGAYACYDLFVYDRETDELTWISAVK